MGVTARHTEHLRRRGRLRNTKQEMAQKAWRLVMRVAERQMEAVDGRLMDMDLSPVQGHFLDELARMPPGPMSQLVARMHVDPGWVTDIVDKLEERGDVVRKSSPEDRRVKILELTDKGRETWHQMDEAIATPPRELYELSNLEIRMLLQIAERLAAAAHIEPEVGFS